MIEGLLKNPRVLTDDDVEKYANDLVKKVAEHGMNYQDAFDILKGHSRVYREAVYHLGHNAAIELKDSKVTFSLDM